MKTIEIIQILGGAITLLAAIWHVAEVKSELEKEIDVLDIKHEERRELVDYKLNSLNEKIDHRFSRLSTDISNVNKYKRDENSY